MQSYIFDFKKSTKFLKKWNKEFDVEAFDSSTFQITLVDGECANNFSDCVDSDGQLIYTSTHSISAECELDYVVQDNTESIVLKEDCTFDFDGETYPTSFKMKGAFLTTDTGFVLGYSINQYTLEITTQMIFEKDLTFFDIVEVVSDGE